MSVWPHSGVNDRILWGLKRRREETHTFFHRQLASAVFGYLHASMGLLFVMQPPLTYN
jgi:hypothetical protein